MEVDGGSVVVTGSLFAYNGVRVNLNGSSATVTNSTIDHTSGTGVYLQYAGTVQLTNVVVDHTTGTGVYEFGGNLTLTGSTVQNSGGDGVAMVSNCCNCSLAVSEHLHVDAAGQRGCGSALAGPGELVLRCVHGAGDDDHGERSGY